MRALSLARSGAAAAIVLLLASCATEVQVRHNPTGKLGPGGLTWTSRVFLVLQVPPTVNDEDSALGKAVDFFKAFSSKDTDRDFDHVLRAADFRELARAAAASLAESNTNVVGCQVLYGSAPVAWLSDFGATGTLVLEPPAKFSVEQRANEREVETTDKVDGKLQKRTVKETHNEIKANFFVRWRFYAEPSHTMLAEGSYPSGGVVYDEKDGPWREDLAGYMTPKMGALMTSFLGPLKDALYPKEIVSTRKIRGGKDDMKAAEERAKKGDWPEATRLWQARLAAHPEQWEPHYNLGVYHEMNERLSEAAAEYKAALERAGEKGDRDLLTRLLGELKRMEAPPAVTIPSGPPAFYQAKLAVLPFANETTDLSAFDYLRLKTFETLAGRGYSLLPLTDVDQKLLEQDIREGGQLNLLTPAQLAKAVGADRLLYGTLEEFKVVNIGVFFKRQVRLRLRLVDSKGRTLWENAAQTVYQTAAKPKEAAVSFVLNLAKTTVDKVAKTYLKEESDETVLRSVESLPWPVPAASN